jgi:hypothetical protein
LHKFLLKPRENEIIWFSTKTIFLRNSFPCGHCPHGTTPVIPSWDSSTGKNQSNASPASLRGRGQDYSGRLHAVLFTIAQTSKFCQGGPLYPACPPPLEIIRHSQTMADRQMPPLNLLKRRTGRPARVRCLMTASRVGAAGIFFLLHPMSIDRYSASMVRRHSAPGVRKRPDSFLSYVKPFS